MFDYNYMKMALEQAKKTENEIPVGAVIVNNKGVISSAHNLTICLSDPTAHAEMIAIRRASNILAVGRLYGCDIYTTLEPCPMCAQAISFARIRRLYFGAYNQGSVEGAFRFCTHVPEIYGGILETESSLLLKQFFRMLR